MSTPQPNAPTTPAGSAPPVIPMPTTPLGAVQTMISMLPPPAGSQGAPSPYPTHAPPLEMLSDLVPVLTSGLPAHAPPAHAPATYIPVGITMPAAASVSSQGRNSPPRGPPHVMRSYSAHPEHSLPPRRPILVSDGNSETMGRNQDDEEGKPSSYKPGTVGARLDQTVKDAQDECKKAEANAKKTEWFLNIATILQVLLGALTTAVGAALSGKHTSIAISTLGGAATVVASYLARSRASNEPEASRNRAQALNHFVREVQGFQLDYGDQRGPQWNDRIMGYRLGLEHMLGNKPGSVTVHPGILGSNPAGADKPVGAMNPAQGRFDGNGDGMYPSTVVNNLANKFGLGFGEP